MGTLTDFYQNQMQGRPQQGGGGNPFSGYLPSPQAFPDSPFNQPGGGVSIMPVNPAGGPGFGPTRRGLRDPYQAGGGYAAGHAPADFTQNGSWAQQAGGGGGSGNRIDDMWADPNFVNQMRQSAQQAGVPFDESRVRVEQQNTAFGGGGGNFQQYANSQMQPQGQQTAQGGAAATPYDYNTPPPGMDDSTWNTPENSAMNDYQRNIEQEGFNNIKQQANLAPSIIQGQKDFAIPYKDVNYNYSKDKAGETAGTQADIMGNLQGGINNSQNQQRANDVNGLGGYAQDYRNAIDSANPEAGAVRNAYAGALTGGAPQIGQTGNIRDVNSGQVGQVNDQLLNNLNVQAGNASKTGLQQTQEQMAAADLAKGGSLAPEEVNNLVQQIRGRGESSGLVNSNRTFANELLGLDSAQRQRQGERMAQAQSTDAAGYGQTQGNRDFALNTVGQNRGVTGQNMQGAMFNVGNDLTSQQSNQGADQYRAGLNYQTQATNAGLQQNQTNMLGQGYNSFNAANDPMLAMYNKNSQAPSLSQGTMYQNSNDTQLGQALNPSDAYAGDLNDSNANANWSKGLQDQNISYAKQKGYMDWGAQLLPGVIGGVMDQVNQRTGGKGSTGGSTSGSNNPIDWSGVAGSVWNGIGNIFGGDRWNRNFQ